MFHMVCDFNLIRLCVINWIVFGTVGGAAVLCELLFGLCCLDVQLEL